MRFQRMPGLMVVAATVIGLATLVDAQQPVTIQPGDLRLHSIRKDLVRAPDFGGGSGALGGGKPSTLYNDWLRIETQFETKRIDWADDIVLKFYVLMGRDPNSKLFSGEVKHVNVARGQQHYSAMFVHPNTVRRYGSGRVEAVAVLLFYQERLMGLLSDPPSNERWWERFTPIPGYVLNPLQTPWSVLANERYEEIKGSP